MRKIRDSKTYELPENFEEELNRWSLEAISTIALDTRLGIMGNLDKNSKEHEFIAAVKTFFYLLSTLDFKPSLWKIFSTADFKEMTRVLDVITDFTLHQVNEAKKRIESSERSSTKHENEQSILEKLIKINPNIATVMAVDMIIAGVDTVSCNDYLEIFFKIGFNCFIDQFGYCQCLI